jgi:hypothetical protein
MNLLVGLKYLKRYGDTIWPIAHFFWGYSVALPIFLLIFWLIKRKVKVSNLKEFLKKRAPGGVVGGIWAMIPDMDYFLEEPMFRNASWNDVFFFHTSFDNVVPETDLFFAAEIFLIFMAVNLFALAATVESFKRLGEALFGKDEEEEEEGPAIEEEGKEEKEKEEGSGEEEEKESKEIEQSAVENRDNREGEKKEEP